MAIIESTALFRSKDEAGNDRLIYPVTVADNVDGLEELIEEAESIHKGIATQGTGDAYTATVPGITALVSGISFTMLPNVASTSKTPTLNVNDLGAKTLRARVSGCSTVTTAPATTNWLASNKPVRVVYDGTFWVTDIIRPNVNDLYGTVNSDKVNYDNSDSGLTSSNIKSAIDELASTRTQTASLTTSEYEALTVKNENTLYILTDGEEEKYVRYDTSQELTESEKSLVRANVGIIDISKQTSLPSSGSALSADTEYRVASAVGTYEFNFPASGDVYVRFTTDSTFSISFTSGTSYLGAVPKFKASTTYEMLARDGVVASAEVVTS